MPGGAACVPAMVFSTRTLSFAAIAPATLARTVEMAIAVMFRPVVPVVAIGSAALVPCSVGIALVRPACIVACRLRLVDHVGRPLHRPAESADFRFAFAAPAAIMLAMITRTAVSALAPPGALRFRGIALRFSGVAGFLA